MDQLYDKYHKQARDLEFQLHDAIDDHNNPTAHVLREEFRRLAEDFEQKRKPESIAARMQTIERQMAQAHHSTQGQFISPEHSMHFQRVMQDMRSEVKHWHGS